MGGYGGVFIDRGKIDNIDNAVKTGAYETNNTYEYIFVFAAARGVIQIKLSTDGAIVVRDNRDHQYYGWSAWKEL